MKKIILAIISSLSGLIIILGLFLQNTIIGQIKNYMLEWAIIVGSIAMVIAIFNLLSVHWNKVFTDGKRDYASPFFIAGFVTVLLVGLALSPTNEFFLNISKYTMISVETSMMGVLALTLSLASFRFFRKKQNLLAIVFGISTVIFLLLFSGILSTGIESPFIQSIFNSLHALPIAGSTGILLGIALGAIVTSIRVLLGFFKPYDRK